MATVSLCYSWRNFTRGDVFGEASYKSRQKHCCVQKRATSKRHLLATFSPPLPLASASRQTQKGLLVGFSCCWLAFLRIRMATLAGSVPNVSRSRWLTLYQVVLKHLPVRVKALIHIYTLYIRRSGRVCSAKLNTGRIERRYNFFCQ